MKNVTATIIVALTILLFPYLSYGQQVEAPVYKDGEYWIFELSTNSPVAVEAGKYKIKRVSGEFAMTMLKGSKEEELDSDYQDMLFRLMPFVARGDDYQWLKFPLGKNTFRYSYEFGPRFVSVDSTVTVKGKKIMPFKGKSLEVVMLEKEDVMFFGSKEAEYLYSPRTKSVITASSTWHGGRVDGTTYTVKLVDYQVK